MKKRILIIEDEPPVLQYLATFLGREGYEVETAETAQEGLTAVETSKPDLVLLDLMLPDASGCDVLDEIKAKNRALPVLIVSGASPNDTRLMQCLQAGAAGCVSKTATVASLLEQVRRALKQ